MFDQTESFKLLLSVSTSLYIRATLLCLTFYIHTHERASKQTWLPSERIRAHEHERGGFSAGASRRMNQQWVKKTLYNHDLTLQVKVHGMRYQHY